MSVRESLTYLCTSIRDEPVGLKTLTHSVHHSERWQNRRVVIQVTANHRLNSRLHESCSWAPFTVQLLNFWLNRKSGNVLESVIFLCFLLNVITLYMWLCHISTVRSYLKGKTLALHFIFFNSIMLVLLWNVQSNKYKKVKYSASYWKIIYRTKEFKQKEKCLWLEENIWDTLCGWVLFVLLDYYNLNFWAIGAAVVFIY